MDREQLQISPRAKRAPGDVRLAFRHVTSTPALWVPLGAMVVVGTLSFNFQVLMPLLAHTTWHGTATTYALMTMAMGVGSVCGALLAGGRGQISPRLIVGSATAFGVFELLAAVAPSLPLQILALVPLGAVSVTFAAGVNSSLQLAAAPAMRGRVMSLYSVVFLGSTPIGAPLVGWLAQATSPRAGLALGGAAALVAAAGARVAYARWGEGALKLGERHPRRDARFHQARPLSGDRVA
jgi:MFS family permease